ncbi:MAG: phosphatase PAP2 family protein [Candidatus Micrarchaeales archaeon]|nr:phosphatase PAP2 family protein [Candidatus Micrarchaeales archaeon]
MLATLILMLFNSSQVGINIWAFQAASSIASPALNAIMVPFAESFFIVLPFLALYLVWKRDNDVYSFILAAVVLFALGEVLKYIFQEARPCSLSSLSWINHPVCESGFAFPSNHAITLTGLIFFLKRYRILQVLYIIWLVVILFGRIYLGQHYLTDVVAGAIISLIIGYVIYHYRNKVYALAQRLRLDILTPKQKQQIGS